MKTKVFISWSGEQSHEYAKLLKRLINKCIQSTEIFVSSSGIDKGAVWFSEISRELDTASVGIICLTSENKEKPWIMYESGALAAGLSKGHVCTVLIDLDHTDVKDPLAQYNHTSSHSKPELRALLNTINNATIDDLKRSKEQLDEDLNDWWSLNSDDLNKLKSLSKPPVEDQNQSPSRGTEDLLREVLTRVRRVEEKQGSINLSDDYKNEDRDEIIKFGPSEQTKYVHFRSDEGIQSWFSNNAPKAIQQAFYKSVNLGEKHAALDLLDEFGLTPSISNRLYKYHLRKIGIDRNDSLNP